MKTEINFRDLKKNYDKKIVRKLKDMSNSFKNQHVKGNPLLYTVYTKDYGTFEITLTVIEPGNVNGEFYMTKGHRHLKNREEIYILVSGKGKIFIQKKGSKAVEMKKDKIYTVSGKAGHRAINTGNGKLEFLSIYSKDAGHNYHVKFKKRFFKNKK
ncbi:cupin domain-containing protein [Candidatus Pacearchaeota archaeon]|nr:cupin domain-containing protein [Candidatus Pacearchaeota archaeon]